MAKDLVRTRKGREKFINLTASLRVMSLQMSEVASQQALTDSMRNITRVRLAPLLFPASISHAYLDCLRRHVDIIVCLFQPCALIQAMTTMNRQFNVPELQATMREFQKQSEMMGMKQEVCDHTCASAVALHWPADVT